MTKLKLGGPVFSDTGTPEKWIRALRKKGYEAAYLPLRPGAPSEQIAEYRDAARENGILIAECGAWVLDPMSRDQKVADASCKKIIETLAFADRIGAACCVSVSGNRGEPWDGPDPDNLTEETFDILVMTVRRILSEASPEHSKYCLEMMPWMYPRGLDDMRRLLDAVSDPRFGVHYDPCNTIYSVERFYGNGNLMQQFIAAFSDRIVSIHVKDVELLSQMTFHLEERCPGDGSLQHGRLLQAVSEYCPETPLMLEHLSMEEEYDRAAAYLRKTARQCGLEIAEPEN